MDPSDYLGGDVLEVWKRRTVFMERYFQIKNWLKYFPKSQIFVLSSSEFNKHSKECTEELLEYFGLGGFEVTPLQSVGSA